MTPNGILGFICADRWMKNKYGGALRAMIAKDYNLEYYIDMMDTPAFTSEVIAYPAITVIKRAKAGLTRINDASYAERYNILCRKLVQEGLYSSASVIISPRTALETGEYTELSEMTNLKTFVSALAGHIAVEVAKSW